MPAIKDPAFLRVGCSCLFVHFHEFFRIVRPPCSFYDLPCNLDPVTSEGRQRTRHPRQCEHRGTSLRWVRDLNPPSDRPGKTLSDESPCIPSAGSPFHG